MEPQAESLKLFAGDLRVQLVDLLSMLKDAKGEALATDSTADWRSRIEWVETAAVNVSNYLKELENAMKEKAPTGLLHAAEDSSVVHRYVNDFDYSWYSRHPELKEKLSAVRKASTPIILSIDRFNQANLEASRKALE